MNQRLYAYFERADGKKRWERKSRYAYRKNAAVRIFQGRLLDATFSGRECALRPVTLQCDMRLECTAPVVDEGVPASVMHPTLEH